MKIRIASDLHLEAYRGRDMDKIVGDIFKPHAEDSNSVLVLAGDISADFKNLIDFIKHIENDFAKVIYIPGNHEYYGKDYSETNNALDGLFKSELKNTVWCNGSVDSHIIDNVRFIYGTMWADGGKSIQEEEMVGAGLNDFRIIGHNGRRFTVAHMQNIFYTQKGEIKRLLQKKFDGKNVVITHHIPSYKLCHPRFGTDINGGFAGDCENILESPYAPDVWIYGHTHDSHDEMFMNTRMVCNPKGYPREHVGMEFNSYVSGPKLIEV